MDLMNTSGYIFKLMRYDLLSVKQELDLWDDRENTDSINAIINAHAKLVVKIAFQHKNYGLPIEDLVQEGLIGLIKAAKRFQADQNARFATYAKWWIRATIQDYILSNWSIVRAAAYYKKVELLRKLKYAKEKIDWDPSFFFVSEIHKDVSISSPIFDNPKQSLQNYLCDCSPNPEEVAIEENTIDSKIACLEKMINRLSAIEQQILHYKFMHQGEGLEFQFIAEKMGIPLIKVKQIYNRTLRKLKLSLKNNSQILKTFIQ